MADEDNIVGDSMDSNMEECISCSPLLGDLCKIMNNQEFEDDLQCDSDETMLTAHSEELTVSLQRPTQVGSDEDTCLSSDSSLPAPQSQISLFPAVNLQFTSLPTLETNSQRSQLSALQNSKEIRLTNQNTSTPIESGRREARNLCLPLQQKQRAKRKRKARNWTFSRCSQLASTSISQSNTKHSAERRPYLEKHRSYMEELNVIEAKYSSVEKLMARKSRALIERAKKMMYDDVRKRLDFLKKDFDQPTDSSSSAQESDSEQENEIAGLRSVRETRLNKMLTHYDVIKQELELKLEESIDMECGDRSPGCSQSILPHNSLHQTSNTLRTLFLKNKSSLKFSKSVVDVIRPEKLLSDQSVIYVPLINSEAPSGGKRRAVTNTLNDQAFLASQSYQQRSCYDYVSPDRSRAVTSSLISRRQSIAPAGPKIYHFSPVAVSTLQPRPFRSRPNTSKSTHSRVAPSQLRPIARNKPKLQTSQLCSRRPEDLNATVYSFSSFGQSQPVYSQLQSSYNVNHFPTLTNQSTNATSFDISDLLRLGLVSRGPGVLSCVIPDQSLVGKASIVGDGLILTPEYELIQSPVDWLKKLTTKTVTRTTAYKQVFYRGVSLFDISTRCGLEYSTKGKKLSGKVTSKKAAKRGATETLAQNPVELLTTTAKDPVIERPPDPLDNLSEFMRTCTIRLVQDSELFVTSALFENNSWSEWKLLEHLLDGC